ncbi:MAG: UDP-2,3-diacylglucosamine diphosphatase [Zoogloeaceae bacterium]|nr:UDP-2,3-diacylglucosamine diphosphatase [Zoogloeaceae bacterium]
MTPDSREGAMFHFIADLHLSPRTPGALGRFSFLLLRLARERSCGAPRALYILGDFFDAWIGDDDDDPFVETVAARLKKASLAGVDLFFLSGNRDFLLGEAFSRRAGWALLPDVHLLSANGWQLILTHGDALCTNDTAYQRFREETRAVKWREDFLRQPLSARREIAARMRKDSAREKNDKAEYLTDVSAATTEDLIRAHGYATLIHGHTHRPARHDHFIDGIHVERWVLADWSETAGEVLSWDGETLARQILS